MFDREHTKVLSLELAHRCLIQVTAETVILAVLALTALLSNVCVLFVFYKSPRSRSITNYYLMTLATTNLIFVITIMPLTIVVSLYGKDVLGNKAGQVIGFIGVSLVFGLVQTTSLIAINRFFCVVKPLLYKKYFRTKPAILMIIGVWVFSVLNVTAVYFSGAADFEFYPGRLVHMLVFKDQTTSRIFAAIFQVMFTVFPMTITGVCYWKVYRTVKGHSARVSSSLNTSLTKEDIHITRSVLPLVCGFIICWIPCSTVFHLAVYVNLPRSIEMCFTFSAYSSYVINPIVYNIFNKPFRKQFIKVIFPKLR